MLLLEGARLVDGSGAASRVADVAVEGDRIAAIGDLHELSGERLDARGLWLTPGFIDIHTHADLTVLADPRTFSESSQGVTAQVVGNCGFSAAPLPAAKSLALQTLGPVPPLGVRWKRFADYRERLAESPPNTHVVPFVGHGALRRAVLPDAAEPSSPEGVRLVCRELERSFDEGARGLSLGLEYSPGRVASRDELLALCRVAATRNARVSVHARNRDVRFRDSVREILDLGRETGARVHVSHIAPKCGGDEAGVEWALQEIDVHHGRGFAVSFDEIPYAWGTTRAAAVLAAPLFEGEGDEVLRRLRAEDAAVRLEADRHLSMWRWVPLGRWDKIELAYAPGSEADCGSTFDVIARRKGVPPFRAAVEIFRAAEERWPEVLWRGHLKREEDLQELLGRKDCLLCSDGIGLAPDGPLQGLRWSRACYGWAARAAWALERRGFSMEQAVHRLTGAAAEWLGWRDRGRIVEGASADLVLIDPAGWQDRTSSSEPHQKTGGIRQVWIAGRPVLDGERIETTSAGRVL